MRLGAFVSSLVGMGCVGNWRLYWLQNGRMWGRQAVQGSDNQVIKRWTNTKIVDFQRRMVPRGLEPRTLRLLAVRSNQLSYETSDM